MTHVPMYFTLKDGEVRFDEEQFDTMVQANEISASVAERAEKLNQNFGDMFGAVKAAVESDKDEDEGALNIITGGE